MKDVEMKLISELMKDCRRSDRELAKAIGTSQPTVSRVRLKLEKEGLIEYIAIPDVAKFGIGIVAVTFGKRNLGKFPENLQLATDFAKEHPNVIFASDGLGFGYNRIAISIHKTYSDYAKFIQDAKDVWQNMMNIESFIIDTASKGIVQRLSFKQLTKLLE